MWNQRIKTDMKEQSIELDHIKHIANFSSDYSSFGRDYVFSRLKPGTHPALNYESPWRFNGMTLVLALEGFKSIEVNLEMLEVSPASIISIHPDSIVRMGEIDWSHLEAYVLFMSRDFIRDINLDMNVINASVLMSHHKPVIKLSDKETELVRRYLELLHLNASEDEKSLYVKSIARNLVAALVYQIMEAVSKRKNETEEEPDSHSRSRRVSYVHDFMTLVNRYHGRERSVGFYADKLYISPKYLSLIIKESTGRSAAEWIDEYVILEAKNLLRFSGKNIQQIAYELNFTNQSSFGKYFKHLTGMSPSEFQRS